MNSIFRNPIIEWSSLYILSILLMMNLSAILPRASVEKITNLVGLEVFAVGLMLLIIGFNFIVFISKKKYVKIIEDYRNSEYSAVSGFLVFLYVAFTLSIFFLDTPH